MTTSASNAKIYRITHIRNLPWILQQGLSCPNSLNRDPQFQTIGDPDLITKRSSRYVPIPPGGTLSDYIPFYFTPFSPMLYKIKTGNGVPKRPMSDIVILGTTIEALINAGVPYVYTNGHAYLAYTEFFTDPADLGKIDWSLLRKRDFQRDPNDPQKVDRYQAEALVYQHLPVSTLQALICYDEAGELILKELTSQLGLSLSVIKSTRYYFE